MVARFFQGNGKFGLPMLLHLPHLAVGK